VTGNFNVTGTVFGESANDTGTQAAAQTVTFNYVVQVGQLRVGDGGGAQR
jgi:hypothetical protein